MAVKYRRNIAFKEARKIVLSYMKDNTYANGAQRLSLISNKNHQPDKYIAQSARAVEYTDCTSAEG